MILPENRSALERRPDLLARLETCGAWRVEAGARGAKVLVGPSGPVTSRYDPAKEAAREAEKLRGGPSAVALLFGFGLGDLARAALARGPGVAILYEPHPEALAAALASVSAADLLADERLVLVLGSGRPEDDVFLVVSNLEGAVDPVRSARLEVASLPVLAGIAARLRPQIEETWMRSFADVLTSFAHETRWFENAVRNLRTLPRLAPLGARPLAGHPAILVAAGPSLAANVEDLRPAVGRIPIVAVDTALRALAARGIRPDVAVSVDANPLNETDLEGLPEEFFRATLLAADVVSAPRFFTSFERTFAFRTRNYCLGADGRLVEKPMGVAWMLERVVPDLPAWQSGGSVATNALSLLIQWGADPVIFVGQDLAFTGGGAHVPDVAYEEAKFAGGGRFATRESDAARNIAQARFRVPAWGGRGEVATTRVLWSYLRWFESTKEQGFGKGRRWIDATEGGAAKRGFEEMRLRDAVAACAPPGDAGPRALATLAARPPLDGAVLEAGLARIAAALAEAGARGGGLLERARSLGATHAESEDFLEEVREKAFLLECLALRHLRAAYQNEDPRERAALVGRIVDEAARYACAKLAAPEAAA